VGRAKAVLRAVLPPIVVSAIRFVRRRLLRVAYASPQLRLSDGVVQLRPIDTRDRNTIERASRDPDISRRFGLLKARPSDYFDYFWEGSRDGRAVAFAISDVEGECLGLVTVERRDAGRADAGYWLLPEGRGGGRATRALRLASRWALAQPGVARVQLWTAPDNLASQKVAEGSGFRREGLLRSYHDVDGLREDSVFFSLLPGDLVEPAEDDELRSGVRKPPQHRRPQATAAPRARGTQRRLGKSLKRILQSAIRRDATLTLLSP
jgi:[ribosomal protein S5]-alanine N-acetyltransferase